MSGYPHNLDTRPLTTWLGELTPAHKRVRSNFSATLSATLRTLTTELGALGCKHPVLEVAVPDDQWRLDGRPRANAREIHPGIVLSLPSTKVGPLRYATDTFTTWQDNLRAVALGLEALRKVDRYGITKRGEQYAGFKALPPGTSEAPTGMTSSEAVQVVTRLAMVIPSLWEDPANRRGILRSAKAGAHPDRNGGARAVWDELERAEKTLARAGAL